MKNTIWGLFVWNDRRDLAFLWSWSITQILHNILTDSIYRLRISLYNDFEDLQTIWEFSFWIKKSALNNKFSCFITKNIIDIQSFFVWGSEFWSQYSWRSFFPY